MMALLDDDAWQPGQHDLDPAAIVDSSAWTVHIVDARARALDG
jgi:hypothetical protein